jgi:hypothetical protein
VTIESILDPALEDTVEHSPGEDTVADNPPATSNTDSKPEVKLSTADDQDAGVTEVEEVVPAMSEAPMADNSVSPSAQVSSFQTRYD